MDDIALLGVKSRPSFVAKRLLHPQKAPNEADNSNEIFRNPAKLKLLLLLLLAITPGR